MRREFSWEQCKKFYRVAMRWQVQWDGQTTKVGRIGAIDLESHGKRAVISYPKHRSLNDCRNLYKFLRDDATHGDIGMPHEITFVDGPFKGHKLQDVMEKLYPSERVLQYNAWLRGGCVVCAADDRTSGKRFAHDRCFSELSSGEKSALFWAESKLVKAEEPKPEPAKKEERVFEVMTKAEAADKLFRFLAALQIPDHPIAVQKEMRALIQLVGPVLNPKRGAN
jgi:hypothetical protein